MPQIPQTLHELTVGQLSARSGAAVSALHFYEAKGLISSRRTSGNQRRYSRDALRRVAFVRAAQRVGIPLATIRDALAELPEERTPNRDDWARLSETWRSELDERIKQLGRPARPSDRLHRLRLPVAGDVCALQPERHLRRHDQRFAPDAGAPLGGLPVESVPRAGGTPPFRRPRAPHAADARSLGRIRRALASAPGVSTGRGTTIPQPVQTGPDHGAQSRS